MRRLCWEGDVPEIKGIVKGFSEQVTEDCGLRDKKMLVIRRYSTPVCARAPWWEVTWGVQGMEKRPLVQSTHSHSRCNWKQLKDF